MPRQKSMQKKRMAQTNPPGMREMAIGKAMKARPVPDRPMDERSLMSPLWMHGLTLLSSLARYPRTGKTTKPAKKDVPQLMHATFVESPTKSLSRLLYEAKAMSDPKPTPSE